MKTHVIARDNHPKVPSALDFYVDFTTGDLSGDSARLIKNRFLVCPPDGMADFAFQQSFPAPDPLRNPASMSLILKSWGYHEIEGELGDLEKYPWPVADELAEDEVS